MRFINTWFNELTVVWNDVDGHAGLEKYRMHK